MSRPDPLPAPDPRDPLHLADDAPLLEGWLRAMRQVDEGVRLPFTVPGHKQRTDLVGGVVAGDLPMFGGLGHDQAGAGAAGRGRAASGRAVGCGLVPVLGRRLHARQPGAGARRRPRPARRWSSPAPCTARCCWAWCWPGCTRCGCARTVDPVTGLPTAVPVAAVRRALAAHPAARAVFLGDPSYVGTRRGPRRPRRGRARRRGAARSSTPPGPRTSASTRACRRTRWPPVRTRW